MERKIYITKQDYQKLQKMFEEKNKYGSSNVTYMTLLAEELQKAEIVPAEKIGPHVVTMNSRVRFTFIDSGETMTHTIVFPEDADIGQRKISILSPIGTALIGYRVGDVVQWPTPAKIREIRIEEILYQPEAAGEV